jgi:hypothetical protein
VTEPLNESGGGSGKTTDRWTTFPHSELGWWRLNSNCDVMQRGKCPTISEKIRAQKKSVLIREFLRQANCLFPPLKACGPRILEDFTEDVKIVFNLKSLQNRIDTGHLFGNPG